MNGRTPRLCTHKASGLAYVTDPRTKRETYFGPAGTTEAHAGYAKWLEGWKSGQNGQVTAGPEPPPDAPLSVARLCARYLVWARGYYVKRGKETSEVHTIIQALERLVRRSGQTPAASYGPRDLAAYRDAAAAEKRADRGNRSRSGAPTVKSGRGAARRPLLAVGEPSYDRPARSYVNKLVAIVKRVWVWAVAEELLPPERLVALRTVPGLKKGRSQAREPEKVKPVPLMVVRELLPYLKPRLRSLVLLQLFTGCRPGEAVVLRPCDVDRSVLPWEWRPEAFKTEHHEGSERVIYLGPKARSVVAVLIAACRHQDDYVFRSKGRGPHRHARGHLRERSYSKQLRDAVRRVNRGSVGPPLLPLPGFTPLQLRHAAATAVRAAYGLEAVQSVLGHQKMQTSEIYATRLESLGREAAEALG